MLTEKQREFRRKGITATDVTAILGFDPYRSGWQVQQEKRGADNFKGNLFTRAGEALEPVIARQYVEDNDGVVLRQGHTAQHPEFPLLLATPDYVVFDIYNDRPQRLVECKSVFNWKTAESWGPPETDRVPLHHFVQVQWQLGVMRISEADVARFYGGDVRYWRVQFDAATFAELRGAAEAWWEKHVVKGIDCEPKAIDLAAVERAQRPVERDEIDAATPEEAALLERWRALYKQSKAIEKALSETQAKAIEKIGVRLGIESDLVKVKYGVAKSRASTDWIAIVRKLGGTPDDILAHTRTPPSYRRVWCSFWNEKEE